MYVSANDLLRQLHHVHGTEQLLSWTDELGRLQANWRAERDAFLAAHLARQAAEAHAFATQQSWLEKRKADMEVQHCAVIEQLAQGLAQAKGTLLQQCDSKALLHDNVEQAVLKRQRLARCRLRREEERLNLRKQQLVQETRERDEREAALLEREQARAEERRARLEMERRRLEVALEKDRALWHPLKSTVATQTVPAEFPLPPADAAAQTDIPEVSQQRTRASAMEASVTKRSMSSSFESASQNASQIPGKERSRRSSSASASGSLSKSLGSQSGGADLAMSESASRSHGSRGDRAGRMHSRGHDRRSLAQKVPSEVAEDSLASIASSVNIAESIESVQSVPSA